MTKTFLDTNKILYERTHTHAHTHSHTFPPSHTHMVSNTPSHTHILTHTRWSSALEKKEMLGSVTWRVMKHNGRQCKRVDIGYIWYTRKI